MITSVNYNNTNSAETNQLFRESSIKLYTKNSTNGCIKKLTKSLINNRIIKKLPNGTIGLVAGAGIGFIIIKAIYVIAFSLTSNNEKNAVLSNIFFNDTIIFVELLYTLVCAILGYYIELENCHKSNRYSI